MRGAGYTRKEKTEKATMLCLSHSKGRMSRKCNSKSLLVSLNSKTDYLQSRHCFILRKRLQSTE